MCPLDHGCRLGGVVLAVGIESNHVLRPAGEGCIEAGLEGSALPEIERVSRGVGSSGASDGSSVVTRGVIDDEDTWKKVRTPATTPPMTDASLNAGITTHVSEPICI